MKERTEESKGHTTICNPDPTSLIASASSVYPRVEKYLNHRKTGGICAILTKNLRVSSLYPSQFYNFKEHEWWEAEGMRWEEEEEEEEEENDIPGISH